MMKWLQRNSLWLVGLGLMLSSSGVDGAYMARWMPAGGWWLGYVLNTTGDIAGEVIMYHFGRLQLEPKNSKKRRLSLWLIPAEIVAVGYSWFFSWRQLRLVLPAVEGEYSEGVSVISAAFVPLLLGAIGFAQAILAGRFTDAAVAPPARSNDATDASMAQPGAAVVVQDDKVTRSSPADAVQAVTVADYRVWAASLMRNNGNLTRDAALAWAAGAGMDVGEKQCRDKVLRWWRGSGEQV